MKRKHSTSTAKANNKKQRAPTPVEDDYEDSGGGYEDLEGGYEDLEGGFQDLEASGAGEDKPRSDSDEDLEADDAPADANLLGNFAASTAGMASSDATRRQTNLYAIPTADEVANLRETAELFKSNVVKLEVRPSH